MAYTVKWLYNERNSSKSHHTDKATPMYFIFDYIYILYIRPTLNYDHFSVQKM